MASLYQILGVRPRATLEEVRAAYRKLAREYHPDVNPDPVAHDRMAEINEAFEVLGDPVRRMEYDSSIGRSPNAEPGMDATIRKPEAVVATLEFRHRVHKTPVYGVAFTPRMGRMITSAFDNEVVWWSDDLAEPERRRRLDGGVVNALRAVNEDTIVAVGSSEHSMACWTLKGDELTSWHQTPKAWVATMASSPNGQSVAVGSVDNILRVVTASKGRKLFHGETHKDSVTAVGWSADSQTVASGSADASVKLWEAKTGKELVTIQEIRSAVTSVAFSPNGRWLAVAAVDLSLRVFDLDTHKLKQKFFGHHKPIESLAFHPHNWLLASGSRDGTVGLWSIMTGVGHGQLSASHQPISCLAFNPKGDTLAAGGLDKVLRVWSLRLPK